MSDLNFIFIWWGKNQAKHSLPDVLHHQGGSVCLHCSVTVWFQRSHTSWLTPWKPVYPLEMNCSISNFIWGNSCWNLWYHRCGVVSSCAQAEATHLGSCSLGASVPLSLWLASTGNLCASRWGRDSTGGAWCCTGCATVLQQSAVPGRWGGVGTQQPPAHSLFPLTGSVWARNDSTFLWDTDGSRERCYLKP